MKRGLFLLATVTLSSALYAQGMLTHEKARQIVGNFNPQLLERVSQDPRISQLVEELIRTYLAQNPADNLAAKYGLAALVRNFDNSLALNAVLEKYREALRFSQVGGDIKSSARAYTEEQLRGIFSRIWAVSVQTKEELFSQYKEARNALKKDVLIPAEQKERRMRAFDQLLRALKADLKQLHTRVGEQLVSVVQATLEETEAQVAAEQTALQEVSNLQVKTKHKKPVAE